MEINKFKSDKLVISEIINFEDMDDDFWINITHKNIYAIRYVKNQTEELCKIAIKDNRFTIKIFKKTNRRNV